MHASCACHIHKTVAYIFNSIVDVTTVFWKLNFCRHHKLVGSGRVRYIGSGRIGSEIWRVVSQKNGPVAAYAAVYTVIAGKTR